MPLVPNAHEPTGRIAAVGWLVAPKTRALVAALQAGGAEVRFVGGCVRDSIARRPVADIDVATPELPETVLARLAHAKIKAVPTGIKHGTITAVVGGQPFEVTTLRRDVATDGRHAKVAFTDDWLEDAKRRDFTINAMSANADGDIFDPFGGITDLAAGRVRFVGRAEDRVDEDYLRILRYFRFFAFYGRPPLDIDALAACRSRAAKLSELSGERVRNELLKILVAREPADIIVRMAGENVLAQILPEAGNVNRLRMLNWLETSAIKIDGIAADPIRHLAALLEPNADAAAVARRLRLSNADSERLKRMVAPEAKLDPDVGIAAEERTIRALGNDRAGDAALLAWATELADEGHLPRSRTDSWIAILQRCRSWTPPVFPIFGADVLALGVDRGEAVGALLASVEDWWENGAYKASRQECLDRLIQTLDGKS